MHTMTRSEAQKRCAELQAVAREGDVRWMARETSEGDWTVVRLKVPGMPAKMRIQGTGQQSPPRPHAPDVGSPVNPNWGV